MLRAIRQRLTYANAMSTIAVMIALGGTSYAAIKLPRNSVGTQQLRNNAVTSAKVRNGTLTKSDFKKGQLTGTAGPSGPQGPPGQPGTPGPAGPAGPIGPQGIPGTNGTDGTDGTDGTNGIDGVDGTARAYGWVQYGCPGSDDACVVQRAKKITAARRVAVGVYCITATDAADPFDPATDLMMVGVEHQQTVAPQGNATAMWSSSASQCNATEFKVVTQRTTDTTTASNASNISFWVAIP